MAQQRCLLFVFAHPDDESFSGAGTALKYAAAGVRAVLVTATRGERGKAGQPPVCAPDELGACRERELRRAAEIIGFDELHLLGEPDRELAAASPVAMRERLAGLMRRLRPAVVVTFDPNGFNQHPDHVAISRFTTDAIAAAADPRWGATGRGEDTAEGGKREAERGNGTPHHVGRLLWTPPIGPWDAVNEPRLDEQPGVDFVVDVSAWRRERLAALQAHRTQHLSIEKYFLSRPDRDRILGVDIWRQAWGPPLRRRPAADIFDGLD